MALLFAIPLKIYLYRTYTGKMKWKKNIERIYLTDYGRTV